MFGLRPRKGRRRTHRQVVLYDRLKTTGRVLSRTLRPLLAASLFGGALYGLQVAESRQHLHPSYQQPPQFEFPNAPPGIAGELQHELAGLADRPWIDHRLCRDVYERLSPNGWVREVRRVGKLYPGNVVVDCEYRRPVALVQDHEYFFAVDEYAVRLPGRYDYHPGWVLVQGLANPPPEAGRRWKGRDLEAAMELVNVIRRQPFADQVAVVLMHNYGGRRDPYGPHIELLTDRQASRILWGSAPGEEIEENSVEQKLHILSENFRRHGRIDAGHSKIDVSVFADRYLILN